MAAPTLISYTQVSWSTLHTGGNAQGSASISWLAGDVIVVGALAEGDQGVWTTPTATGIVFGLIVKRDNVVANSECASGLWAVVAGSNGSSAVAMAFSATDVWGFAIWVYRGSAGIGNSAEQHTSAKTVNLTPTAADGAIVYLTGDFAAAAVQTATPTPTNTRQAQNVGTHYTVYVDDLADQASTGATPYGISGTGSGPFSIVALEIKASAGGGTTDQQDWFGTAPVHFVRNVNVPY